MNHCPNCGAERKQSARYCELCGYSFDILDDLEEKNQKIEQLEHKIRQLESSSKNSAISVDNSQLKYFWIIASIMIIGFFAFIFYFVYMARN